MEANFVYTVSKLETTDDYTQLYGSDKSLFVAKKDEAIVNKFTFNDNKRLYFVVRNKKADKAYIYPLKIQEKIQTVSRGNTQINITVKHAGNELTIVSTVTRSEIDEIRNILEEHGFILE